MFTVLKLLFLVPWICVSPPVLPGDGRVVLETVEDDRGLVATGALDFILDEVHAWPASIVVVEVFDENAQAALVDWPVPNWDAVLKSPESVRGEAFRIEGQLVRRDRKPMGRDALEAWIIQCDPAGDDGSGEHRTTIAAVLVAVDQFDEAQVTHLPADVRIASRFFARLRVPAEDNGEVVLTIPLFVGAHPQIVVVDPSHHAANASRNRLTILIGLISVFGVVFVAVRMALGRSRAARPAHGRTHLNDHRRPEMESDAEAKLPGDPADALAVLHSKSDSTKTEGA